MEYTELELQSKEINNTLKERVHNYFNEQGIIVPDNVSIALDEVFNETMFVSDDEDTLRIYHSDEVVEFESDTKIETNINVQVKGGNSAGYLIEKYTYYGQLDTTGAYEEHIVFYNGEDEVNRFRDLLPQKLGEEEYKTNHLVNKNDWCVIILLETVFEMGDYTQKPMLYIYTPIPYKEIN